MECIGKKADEDAIKNLSSDEDSASDSEMEYAMTDEEEDLLLLD